MTPDSQDARLAPLIQVARQSLEAALGGLASPAGGVSLDDLAVSAVLAVLAEAYRHPGLFPVAAPASGVDGVLRNLITRSQIAARRDVSIATVMSWIDRYPDFPGPVLGKDTRVPYYWWPQVLTYLDSRHLPRARQVPAALDAGERDAKILEILALFPDGLTAAEIATLSGEEQGPDGNPTPHAVRVRYEDRLRRMEAGGRVCRSPRSGGRRAPQAWLLTPAPAAAAAASGPPARLGFPGRPAAAGTGAVRAPAADRRRGGLRDRPPGPAVRLPAAPRRSATSPPCSPGASAGSAPVHACLVGCVMALRPRPSLPFPTR